MLILAHNINCNGSHIPILGDDNLSYPVSIKTNFRRVNDRHTKNTKMPIGVEVNQQLDFARVLNLKQTIENSDDYLIVNTVGKFLGIVPSRDGNNNPPTQMPVTLNDYNLAARSLGQQFRNLKDCLNETLDHKSLETYVTKLQLFIREHTNDNEFISILISTNDQRIESLPFEETSYIRKLVGSRPFGIQFKPGGYLQLPINRV